MPEPKWMPTKIVTRNHELEGGLQGGNYLIQMPWIPLQEEPEEDSWDQKKLTTTHPHTRHKEDSCKEGEEGDVCVET